MVTLSVGAAPDRNGAISGRSQGWPVHAPGLRPLERLLDLALPAVCPGCGAEGPPICATCRRALDSRLALPAGTPLGLADGPPDPLLQLEWCAPFSGTVAQGAPRAQVRGRAPARAADRRGARGPLAGGRRGRRPPRPDPRPRLSSPRARLRPGGAHRGRGGPALAMPWVPALERTRATTAQYHLDRRHRAANVVDAFGARPERGRRSPDAGSCSSTTSSRPARRWAPRATTLLAAGALAVSAITVARASACDDEADGPVVYTRCPSGPGPPARRPRSQVPSPRREVCREDDRQGQEPRGPRPRPAVRRAQVRPPGSAVRRPDGCRGRALERGPPQRRRTPTSPTSR